MLAASAGDAGPQTVEDRRRGLASLTEMAGGEAPEVASVEDGALPGPAGSVPFRLYRPMSPGAGVMVFLHGGGWVAGDLDTHDGVCRRLANASGCAVFAIAWRLAPEHPFPAGLEDACAAVAWVAQNAARFGADAAKLVVAGDSAGGGLAAAAGLLARDRGGPRIALTLLICPILDLATESASRRAFAEGYFLSQATLARDLAEYLPYGSDLYDPRLSPLHAGALEALPPAHIHVAEFDSFRDEGLAFAERLDAAGGTVSSTIHPGMIHYFYAMPGAIPYADKALAEIGAAVKAALGE